MRFLMAAQRLLSMVQPMATIESLNPSILTLNPVEQIALIKKTRLSRRTSKFTRKKKATKNTTKKTKTIKATPKELFQRMSPEQRTEMLKELLGE